eukprot:TCONS_00028158-protein
MFIKSKQFLSLNIFLIMHISFIKCYQQRHDSFFQLNTNTEITNTNYQSTLSISYLQCSFVCQHQDCTAASYNSKDGVCKTFQLPLKHILTSPKEETDSFIFQPCVETPSKCLHGGECIRNVTSSTGYHCICVEPWRGDNCEKPPPCPWPDFIFKREMCYYKNSINQETFWSAQAECVKRGGRLATAATNDGWQSIREIVIEENQWFTIGLTRTDSSGWQWLSGAPNNTIPWKAPFEPSGDGDCASVFPDTSGLNDFHCDIIRRYICERDVNL